MNKIKNIEKASERIKKAAENHERIILYGDSDLDGVSSVVILGEAIKSLGGQVDLTMFPDRENDGYGVNTRALGLLKDQSPALFITLDLGIANVKEISALNDIGHEVIVVDHHEPLDTLPAASIIVDPKQKGDESAMTYVCNGGLTYLLAKEMLGDSFSDMLRNSFLELAALATISDMVPQIGENKIIIEQGLRSLKNTFRPGLRAFIDIMGEGEVAAGGFTKIISAFNAAESVNFNNDSYALLTSHSPEVARELAESLIGKTQFKQQKIREITEEVERRIAKNPADPIIFEGDPAWKLTLAGPVSSIISQRYEKPTFIFKKGDDESCGSVRLFQDNQNSVEAMKTCADLLLTFGGHAKASGFRLKNENLEKFKEGLIRYFQQ